MYINNYDKNVNFLLELANRKLTFNVDNETKKNLWLKCLIELNNPQDKIKVIQVVGTNGKGSTTMYLNWILKQKFKKIGTFTSPATMTFYDRIQINNIAISDQNVDNYLKIIKPLINKYKLSFFQVWTLMGLLHFVDCKVDIAIIEAGIGGKWDSTNIFLDKNQLAVAITSISLDHQNVLGNTLLEIAHQKAAITKASTPIFAAEDLTRFKKEFLNFSNEVIFVRTIKSNLAIPKYQDNNLSIALAIAKNVFNISDIDLNKIPENIIFYRFSTVLDKPSIVIDGAHNDEALLKNIAHIKKTNKDYIVIVGFSANKNIETMKKTLKSNFETIYYVNFQYKNSHHFDNKIDYKILILKLIKDNKNILIIGSLYFASEVYNWGKINDVFK